MRLLKKIVLYLLIFLPIARGFAVARAKKWARAVYGDLVRNRNYSLKEKLWAYRRGYLPMHIEQFGMSEKDADEYISEEEYFYLQPINGIYRKWISNKVTTKKVFVPFKEHFQKFYYQLFFETDDGGISGIRVDRLSDCPFKDNSIESVEKLIMEKKKLVAVDSVRNKNAMITFSGDSFFIDDDRMKSFEELLERIRQFHKKAIIAEYVEPHEDFVNGFHDFGNEIRLIVFHQSGEKPVVSDAFVRQDAHYTGDIERLNDDIRVFCEKDDENVVKKLKKEGEEENKKYFKGVISYVDIENGRYDGGSAVIDGKVVTVDRALTTGAEIKGVVPYWDEIKDNLYHMCMYAPQLEFFGVDILIGKTTFKIIRCINMPEYPSIKMFKRDTVEFLKQKLEEKEIYYQFSRRIERGSKQLKLNIRATFAKAFFPEGLRPYLSVRWVTEVTGDILQRNGIPLRTKLWAHRHGFLSYRLKQYGITKENYKNFISDFEYKWLRHINGSYRGWFEDKITFQYILPAYKEYFPDYYYHIKNLNGKTVIIQMMDCPEDLDSNSEDIMKLAERKKVLALKPDEGSHGDGFYKLSYEDGKLYLNGELSSREGVAAILNNPENQYLITEYIDNHPQFREIYDGAVNTIRMIVFKKDGVTPQIGNAYMRFGSKKTGAVDNMGAGGMFAQVDINTGEYGNAKIIKENDVIEDCPRHPDTGVLIQGTIPHWEKIKNVVLSIARDVTQMEYFGFDVAVTRDGLKFPEINRFPDYPKIEKFSSETIDYLLMKLDQKKHEYGYDVKPCRKLIHLPKR